MNITITEVRERTVFSSLSADWLDLLTHSYHPSPFQSHEWLWGWWQVFGRDKELLVLLAKCNDQLIGAAPFFINKAGIQRTLRFIGDRHSDYSDILVRKGFGQKHLASAFFSYLLKRGGWDFAYLNEVPGDSNLLSARTSFANILGPTKIKPVALCPRLALTKNIEQLEALISQNLRQDVHRKLRKANSKHGLVFKLHAGLSPEDAETLLDQARQLHIERRNTAGDRSMYEDSAQWQFIKSTALALAERDALHLTTLSLESKLAAYIFSIKHADTIYFIHTGFKEAFARLSPGKMLFHLTILDAAETGFRWFDFGREQEAYKTKWTGVARQNHLLEIQAPFLLSRFKVLAHTSVRPTLKELPVFGPVSRAAIRRFKSLVSRRAALNGS